MQYYKVKIDIAETVRSKKDGSVFLLNELYTKRELKKYTNIQTSFVTYGFQLVNILSSQTFITDGRRYDFNEVRNQLSNNL